MLKRNLVFANNFETSDRKARNPKSNFQLVELRPKSKIGMAPSYNKKLLEGEPTFKEVYRELWNIVFEPSPAVSRLLQERLHTLNLQPNQYTVAHVRAQMYEDQSHNLGLVHKSLQCAEKLDGHLPVFVASDSAAVVDQAIEYNGNTTNRIVGWKYGGMDPLHLDGYNYTQNRVIPWQNKRPSDFYDTFVDLYMLASARCVAHGRGGYGIWGSMLSYDPACKIDHEKSKCRR